MANIFMNDNMQTIMKITQDQETGSKSEYKRIAMEVLATPIANPKLVEAIYKDIIEQKNPDYLIINQTKGDFTRYKYFDKMTQSIERIMKVTEAHRPEDVILLEKMYNMLIKERYNFEYGYRMDIEFIQIIYCALVLGLHELLMACIVEYVEYVKQDMNNPLVSSQFSGSKVSQLKIINLMKKIMLMYESGEWLRLMNHFKENTKNFALTSAAAMGAFATIFKGVAFAGAAFAILATVRELVYLFYKSTMDLNEYAKMMNNFLVESMKSETENSRGYKKQKFVANRLESLSSFIEGKIFRNDRELKKKMKDSNKKNFNIEKIRNTTPTPIENIPDSGMDLSIPSVTEPPAPVANDFVLM